ncbi:MAG: divalent cation tolerance protein CutA [Flavobacteriales bacterium]
MILLRIVSKSEAKIEEIAKLLLTEKFVIDVNIKREAQRVELVNDRLKYASVFVLTAKTKATLFATINKRLNLEFPQNLPEIYALPIVEMDWKQANVLRKV